MDNNPNSFGAKNLQNSSSSVTINDASQTLSNKNLIDNSTFIVDNVDNSVQIGFDAGRTTGTTTVIACNQTANRTLTFPDVTATLVSGAGSSTVTGIPQFSDAFGNISDTGLIASNLLLKS